MPTSSHQPSFLLPGWTHPKFLKINFPLGLVCDTSDDMGEFSTQIPEVSHSSMTRSIILLDNVFLAPQVSCGEPRALCQPAHKFYKYLMVLCWVQSFVWWTKVQINSIWTQKLLTLIQLPKNFPSFVVLTSHHPRLLPTPSLVHCDHFSPHKTDLIPLTSHASYCSGFHDLVTRQACNNWQEVSEGVSEGVLLTELTNIQCKRHVIFKS